MNSIFRRLCLATCVAWVSVSIVQADGALDFTVTDSSRDFSTLTASMPNQDGAGQTLVMEAGVTFAGASGSAADGSGFTQVPTQPVNLGSFKIMINPTPALAANTAALQAFQRAAAQWESRISDPVTVNISADLSSALPSNVIGAASSATLTASYSSIRAQLLSDSLAEADDGIIQALPTSAQFAATLPVSASFNGNMRITKANAKAMGYANLDTNFGANDATIQFNANFAFDYDNQIGGVTPGMVDFETVAAHEIGHALGFVSVVDLVVSGVTSVAPYPLDLYRFNAAGVPADTAAFMTAARDLAPGGSIVSAFVLDPWALGTTQYAMSTGLSIPLGGDGNQASHWKADDITGNYIGIMDPTLAGGVIGPITEADFRALDLIGWNITAIPEPGTWGALVVGGIALIGLRRRKLVMYLSLAITASS